MIWAGFGTKDSKGIAHFWSTEGFFLPIPADVLGTGNTKLKAETTLQPYEEIFV